MTRQTKRYRWNASDYARNASAQYRWARELIDKLGLQGNECLLDIGCGDGRVSAELAALLSRGRVLGIDASSEMITAARGHYATCRNLDFHRMDARDIILPQRFDTVFSNAALHWVDDHGAVLAGVHRTLVTGGRVLFQMGGQGNADALFEVLGTVLHDERWRDYFLDFASPYAFYGISDYERWLPQNGFVPVRIELIPKTMHHRNKEELKGWFRTTWFPYTDRLPVTKREQFIEQIIGRYLSACPPDSDGVASVEMVRLQVEAICA